MQLVLFPLYKVWLQGGTGCHPVAVWQGFLAAFLPFYQQSAYCVHMHMNKLFIYQEAKSGVVTEEKADPKESMILFH